MWFTDHDLEAIEELDKGTDRSAAIIALALIDARLSEVLRKKLTPDDSSYSARIRKQLFRPDGALGSFSARICLCHLMGVLTAEAHTDLIILAKIRNDFARYAKHDNFECESIRARCNNLKLINNRLRGVAAWAGTTPIDSISSNQKNNYVALNLVNHELILSNPRQRYTVTAKLFVAACHLFTFDNMLTFPLL
jgi:DNA-binding MltR family transcriptional regulator